MVHFFYRTGWGALAAMLFFQIPFLIIFLSVLYRRAIVDRTARGARGRSLARVEGVWIVIVLALFLAVNIGSIKYMPNFDTARALVRDHNIQQVNVVAHSWYYKISDRKLEVGRPVHFAVTSADTTHGFAVYNPQGRLLFTMMVIPGMKTGLVHTFTEPGTYTIRCLEYCGVGHPYMRDKLIVSKGNF